MVLVWCSQTRTWSVGHSPEQAVESFAPARCTARV